MATQKQIEDAREVVDIAIYDWIRVLGYNADDFDYSALNEMFSDIENDLTFKQP